MSELLPNLSWVIRRFSTKGTGPDVFTNHEVPNQLDVPTSLTPSPIHLLCFYFVGCVKEVSNLINLPVVRLFEIRQGRYICTDTIGKKGIPKASTISVRRTESSVVMLVMLKHVGRVLSPNMVGFINPCKLRKKKRVRLMLLCITYNHS